MTKSIVQNLMHSIFKRDKNIVRPRNILDIVLIKNDSHNDS